MPVPKIHQTTCNGAVYIIKDRVDPCHDGGSIREADRVEVTVKDLLKMCDHYEAVLPTTMPCLGCKGVRYLKDVLHEVREKASLLQAATTRHRLRQEWEHRYLAEAVKTYDRYFHATTPKDTFEELRKLREQNTELQQKLSATQAMCKAESFEAQSQLDRVMAEARRSAQNLQLQVPQLGPPYVVDLQCKEVDCVTVVRSSDSTRCIKASVFAPHARVGAAHHDAPPTVDHTEATHDTDAPIGIRRGAGSPQHGAGNPPSAQLTEPKQEDGPIKEQKPRKRLPATSHRPSVPVDTGPFLVKPRPLPPRPSRDEVLQRQREAADRDSEEIFLKYVVEKGRTTRG
eukprot:TRINITY_DN20702_c0_g1_i1.p1 TRINITY_DN20702_c0_g1~~TRINITY_DN20702_c0_g1_i1.p1  ORF type:complete len:343 (+),score=66.68 TRINITY_DN20702_c0_g1_i1:48-1076(+)